MSYLYSDNQHAFVATTSGLDVYDLLSESLIAYYTVHNGCSSVTGTTSTVYFGTVSGIKYFDKTTITGTVYDTQVLGSSVNDYTDFNLTSNTIEYLNSNDSYLSIVTSAGIDVVKLGSQQYISSTVVSGVKKCFITTGGDLYYTVSGSSYWELNKVGTKFDWVTPDLQYITGSGIFTNITSFNDIFITENDSNTLFLATSSGGYVINEADQTCKIYLNAESDLEDSFIYKILYIGNNFNAVWADNYSTINSGRLYLTTAQSLSSVNLVNNTLYDIYTDTIVGRSQDLLDSDYIIDINTN